MENQDPASQAPLRWTKIGILAAVLSVCLIAIALLGFEVSRKMREQATAGSDNIQWTLAQLEVEFLRLEGEVDTVADVADLSEVRRKFDIFYSRIDTFRRGAVYSQLRDQPDFNDLLTQVASGLDALIPLIDSPDSQLMANLVPLRAELTLMEPPVRAITLSGLEYFALKSDESREEVSLTLMRVAALTIALVIALVIVSIVLFQLYRVAQRNAEEVRTASARLAAMVSGTLDAVIVINAEGLIVEYNGAAEYIFGYSREEVMNQPMVDLIIPVEYRRRHLNGMKRHLTEGISTVVGHGRHQFFGLRKNGEVFPCEFSISRAQSASGPLFVSFLRDTSSQVAAETELMKARDEALAGERARAEFMAVMSHEMRTPLNGMLGTMELMGDTPLTQRQRDYLKIMETSGRLLLHHVNDVLDIARLETGSSDIERRPFDLYNVISEVVDGQRAIATRNKTMVEIDLDAIGHPTVLGDQQRLRQVLLNLTSNAIKFTREGVVRIEAERLGDSDILEFRVIDTGIGIPEDKLEKIFDDFITLDASYSREFGGTGLGLGIARRLVNSMEGAIGVESELGDGSLFWFRLPMPILSSAPPPQLFSEPTTDTSKGLSSLDILVVEDNQINQLVVEEMLTKEGHRVTLANDGEEGVAAAALRRYEVILMDISMPRMDGIEACRRIRAGDGRSKDSRIIALTAHALPSDLEKFEDAGMNDVLVKPISRNKLSKILDIKHAEQAPKPAAPVQSATIDETVVSSLFTDLGAERGNKLLGSFLAETDRVVGELVSEPEEQDSDLIAKIHKLAGSASLFGTIALGDELRTLETMGKSGQAPEMRVRLPEIEAIWSETQEALNAFAANSGAA